MMSVDRDHLVDGRSHKVLEVEGLYLERKPLRLDPCDFEHIVGKAAEPADRGLDLANDIDALKIGEVLPFVEEDRGETVGDGQRRTEVVGDDLDELVLELVETLPIGFQ